MDKRKLIVLNFKTYAESSGDYGALLAQAAETVAKEHPKAQIIICPPTPELALHAKKLSIPVFAQHVDGTKAGAYTGSITVESVKASGAKGTLVNHSEKKLHHKEIEAAIQRATAAGLDTIVCAATVDEAVFLADFAPTAIAVEPPELIGSGISVSTAKPEVVKNAVEKIKAKHKNILVLVGAGISNGQDVAKALELGADGVLLASAFVKAQSPQGVLKAMAKEIK